MIATVCFDPRSMHRMPRSSHTLETGQSPGSCCSGRSSSRWCRWKGDKEGTFICRILARERQMSSKGWGVHPPGREPAQPNHTRNANGENLSGVSGPDTGGASRVSLKYIVKPWPCCLKYWSSLPHQALISQGYLGNSKMNGFIFSVMLFAPSLVLLEKCRSSLNSSKTKKSIKPLEENIDLNLYDLGWDIHFWNMTPKAKTKEKNRYIGLYQK